ncbi:MAG TPA: hypothetical protein VD833_05335 [Vicinamibacterales bacterium]|nr:hypothetical protein [Vicinamibacterales bacterium]
MAVLLVGSAAAYYYAAAGLALAHFDARAHLVVARRILDSLMPGWQQIGAVWLPLPHLLNMLPVQVDPWYRSGASGTAISVLSMAAACWALAWLILRTTGSAAAAVAGAALLMANPNVLYLQSTPMTEPVLFGTTLLSIAALAAWIDHGPAASARLPGLALAAACMTRYEAWPIAALLVALTFAALVRRGTAAGVATLACVRLTVYPVVTILLFMANSRWTTGEWLISSGFYVPDNDAAGHPRLAWQQILDGMDRLSSPVTRWFGLAGAVVVAVAFGRSRAHAALALALAPAAAAALPLYAYLHGHPVRVRYSLPMVVAAAVVTAVALATLPRRVRPIACAIVVALTLYQSPPLDRSAPLIIESLRDVQNREGRTAVVRYLEQHYDGRLVMMSMGSLAHFMHDLSHIGFDIGDFLQEGNGEVWVAAVRYGPRGHVGWVAIEEESEGGDGLFHRARQFHGFLDGFDRVVEGGGVALYRATPIRPEARAGQ